MKSSDLRQKYLEFFEKKGHKIIPSASLIPENDPTVLFTTAGMHPLVPYLLGQKHPEGNKLTSCQKCIRTGDIEEVGDDTHLTFFEMLGNWSLGDYWKEEAIQWSFEFLTKELKISVERLAVSVFEGDDDAPFDKEAFDIWKNLGISEKRIAKLPKEDNWWGPAGQTGPCGPDTEMFYWKDNNEKAPDVFDPKDKRWVEIWNDVFMQYIKTEDGKFVEAKQKNIDTGMGLERTIAVLNGKENVYEADLFLPIIKKIEELSGSNYELSGFLAKKTFRIIADHIKASIFLVAEGVEPSNLERGYVLRKLIRRSIVWWSLGPEKPKDFINPISNIIIDTYKDVYPKLFENKENIVKILTDEQIKFQKVLDNSLKEFDKIAEWWKKIETQNEDQTKKLANKAFLLEQSGGLPVDLFVERLEKFWKDEIVFKDQFWNFIKNFRKNHQERSRTASAGMFKGGLADNSEKTKKLHTTAHLMLAGLRKVLGDHVFQKGSNITAERLRFDFTHSKKMNSGELNDVENFVNGIIKKDLPVVCEEMTLEKAKEINAMGVFESKYGEKVKVYTIADGDEIFSREICGGPHVDRTGKLGHFKIIKEESSSSGVRRIKAILQE
jgi:alanyl-tRNA synthetase